jgi:hypothetical protein
VGLIIHELLSGVSHDAYTHLKNIGVVDDKLILPLAANEMARLIALRIVYTLR